MLEMRVVDGQWHHHTMLELGSGGWGGCSVDDTGPVRVTQKGGGVVLVIVVLAGGAGFGGHCRRCQ